MRIYILNPSVLTAIRGRTSTTIILRERGGQQIELVFTSLKAMGLFADDIDASVEAMEDGRAGVIWQSPRLSQSLEQLARTLYSDPLQDAGVIERPAFLAPQPVIRRAAPPVRTAPPPPAPAPQPPTVTVSERAAPPPPAPAPKTKTEEDAHPMPGKPAPRR
jgi:cell division septation protein DedD